MPGVRPRRGHCVADCVDEGVADGPVEFEAGTAPTASEGANREAGRVSAGAGFGGTGVYGIRGLLYGRSALVGVPCSVRVGGGCSDGEDEEGRDDDGGQIHAGGRFR